MIEKVTPATKPYLGSSAFALAAFRVYLDGELPGMEIVHGDEVHDVQFAIVANSRHYGGEFKVMDKGSLTSGELSVVMIERIVSLLRPRPPGPFYEAHEVFDGTVVDLGDARPTTADDNFLLIVP